MHMYAEDNTYSKIIDRITRAKIGLLDYDILLDTELALILAINTIIGCMVILNDKIKTIHEASK